MQCRVHRRGAQDAETSQRSGERVWGLMASSLRSLGVLCASAMRSPMEPSSALYALPQVLLRLCGEADHATRGVIFCALP